ncbi:MAG: hypothetical protein K2O18_05295 [Oscillospiraceae bacterium]|nr:hypothetical protein [Oscillospiraceae bacterium]
MNGFLKGILAGAVVGYAADMALHTTQGKRTASKAIQSMTDAVDSAAASVKDSINN